MPQDDKPRLYPFLRYDDCPAAIDFLERAFGFEKHAVHEGEGDKIDHAELRYGSTMVMLGSTREENRLRIRTPGELGGITGGVYVVVDDADAHHAQAKGAGAEIVQELSDQDYGSRDYVALDPEGYLWSFGTYAPGSHG